MASPPLVCAIFRDDDDRDGMYVLNLNELEHPSADEFVDLDIRHCDCCHSRIFVEKPPNILFEGFRNFSFYGVDDTLYMIEGRKNIITDKIGRRVYTFKVSPDMSAMSSCAVERRRLPVNPFHMLGPKVKPSAIRRPSFCGILIFSKEIAYADEIFITSTVTTDDVDFELYFPDGHVSFKLPQLRLLRHHRLSGGRGHRFELLHPVPSKCRRFEAPGHDLEDERRSFCIKAYGFIDEYTFVVETDIGVSFSLDINEEDVYMEWVLFRGPEFTDEFENFVIGSDVLLAPSGASKFSTSKEDAVDIAPLPLTSRVSHHPLLRSRHVAIGLLDSSLPEEEYVAGIVHVAGVDEFKAIWSLDVVGLDVSKFNRRRFARRIQSYKILSTSWSKTISVECIFGML